MKQNLWVGLAGALSVAAYAPLEWWWLMPFCLAVLYWHWRDATPKQAAQFGFVFAIGQFGVGVSWVYVSLYTFGNMPPLMAGVAVFLFVALLACFFAALGYCFSLLRQTSLSRWWLARALLFASLWVLADWSRSIAFTGFPWLDVGYTQTTQWLSGFAPIGGVYLVSFMLLLVAVLLAELFHVLYLRQVEKISQGKIVLFGVMIAVVYLSGAGLTTVQWSLPKAEPISVGLVQANIPIEQKWQPEFRNELLQRYVDLMPKQAVDLVVWPETAMPLYLHHTNTQFWQQFATNETSLIAGITELSLPDEKLYNAAIMTCGQEQLLYRKNHLVPFGEYLPLRRVFSWVLDYLQLPMSDFSSWSGQQAMNCGELKIALSICYEDAFANEIRANLGEGEVLVNISEDAWFGDSLAPHQRRQMAQMRAQELARPMVRSANSGPSSLIDADGRILLSTEQFVEQSAVGLVYPRTGFTPFTHLGLWIVYFAGLWVFLNGLLLFRQQL